MIDHTSRSGLEDALRALVGVRVEQLWIWGPIRLVLSRVDSPMRAHIDAEKWLVTDVRGRHAIDAATAPDSAAPMLPLLGRSISLAVERAGTLELFFDDRTKLTAPADGSFEAWTLDVDGRVWQSL